MKFKTEKINEFEEHFDEIKELVRNQPGCISLKLLQDKNDIGVFFTYSIWKDESDLERYRNSSFFKKVWKYTKSLFLEKPEAWSVNKKIEM